MCGRCGTWVECNKTVTLNQSALWHLSHAVSEGKGLVTHTNKERKRTLMIITLQDG